MLAGLFALVTLGTALFTYGVPLLDPASVTPEMVLFALPGTALLAAVLAAHEAGHQWVRAAAPSPFPVAVSCSQNYAGSGCIL